jgi:hypothetical protein
MPSDVPEGVGVYGCREQGLTIRMSTMSSTNVCWDEESFDLLEDWKDVCEEESSSFCRLGDDGSNTYDDEGTRDDNISLSRSNTTRERVAESYTLHTLWIADLRSVECVSLQQVEQASGELDEYM